MRGQGLTVCSILFSLPLPALLNTPPCCACECKGYCNSSQGNEGGGPGCHAALVGRLGTGGAGGGGGAGGQGRGRIDGQMQTQMKGSVKGWA